MGISTMNQGVLFQLNNVFPTMAGRNEEFLIGIATREGDEVYDPNSRCSLWGRLPGTSAIANIDDLETVRDAVTQATKAGGSWRALIKIPPEEAEWFDLDQRKNWETLMDAKINVLAEELGIPQESFCWVASIHAPETHNSSHTHIMLWDSSSAVHPQYIDHKKFEAMKDRVRSAFEEGITELKVLQLINQERAPLPELEIEDSEELEP